MFLSFCYINFEKMQAGSRTIDLELTTLASANHVELTPSDAGFQDRYIVQEIIKEMAKNRPIDTKGKKGYKGKNWCSALLFLYTTVSLVEALMSDIFEVFGCAQTHDFVCVFFVFAVLVLNEVDKLSREAQHSLRRTMEKYSSSCRLILCCNSSSKVTEAIKSRCLNVRINAPSQEEVQNLFLLFLKNIRLYNPPTKFVECR